MFTRSKRMAILTIVLITFLFSFSIYAQAKGLIKPKDFFGYKPGTDRMLLDYGELIEYLQELAQASPKLKMIEIGESPLGRTMYLVFISNEANIQNLDNLKKINKRLALDPDIPQEELKQMFAKGRVFCLATLSMHSNEVGPSQSAPLIAHELITSQDRKIKEWLNNVVYMMVPCHNPDGMDMVVEHYRKYKGTKYEGASLPGIYHKYVGHDNNRDFVTLSQSDNKAVARIYNQTWYPQVMVEKHQMGSGSVRYFVPPMHDPIAENVNASIWNWTWVFGSNMNTYMTKRDMAGVAQHYLFDDYWVGSTETALWKNVIALLTEAAGVQHATPIYIEENELKAYGKGLSEYKKSINMPLPWEGGWWRLSDIVDYEIASTKSMIKTSSLRREDILKFRNRMCRESIKLGKTEPPYYYIFPQEQHDQSELVNMINLLMEHNVTIYQLDSDLLLNDKQFRKGDIAVPLAQPFQNFIKEVLEAQKFPVRHYTPGGKVIKPYDIASWSLPLHRGIESYEINDGIHKNLEAALSEIEEQYSLKGPAPEEYKSIIFSANNNESYEAAFAALKSGLKVDRLEGKAEVNGETIPKGSFMLKSGWGKKDKLAKILDNLQVTPFFTDKKIEIETNSIELPKIGLIESYFHDMDAGWTRYIFDQYNINYDVLRPGEFPELDLGKYDILVFPDENLSVLKEGKYKSQGQIYMSSYPPEFAEGMGNKGLNNLMKFLNQGGKVISWGRSTRLFAGLQKIKEEEQIIEEFQLPFQDVSEDLSKAGLYCPGSLMKITLLKDHPLTLGMQNQIGVFSRGRPVFETSFPKFDMDRRVIGTYAEDDILMSGYCEEEKLLANKTCLLWLKKGKGQLVLFGFQPQFRASTQSNYKLLFNAILL